MPSIIWCRRSLLSVASRERLRVGSNGRVMAERMGVASEPGAERDVEVVRTD